MKQILTGLILVCLFLVFTGFKPLQKNTNQDLNGLWADSNSSAFQNGYVIFSQQGNKVKMMHYIEFNGTPMVEQGEGIIDGNKISYDVVVPKAIPGWATSGKHIFILSPDGKTLRGIYQDGKGNTGPIVFKRAGK